MKNAVFYIHGKGGSGAECEHYRPLFPGCEVFGLDYQSFTPWETGAEIRAAVEKLKRGRLPTHFHTNTSGMVIVRKCVGKNSMVK